MSWLLRVFAAGEGKLLELGPEAGTVELVYSEPERVPIPGREGETMAGASVRKTLRLSDLGGPVKIHYQPPAPAEPGEPAEPMIEVEVDRRGWTAEQRKRYGVPLIPHRLTMPASEAAKLGKTAEQLEAEARERETAA
jgi:hypothetical protein